MNLKLTRALAAVTVLVASVAACTVVSGPPRVDIDPSRHGNLASAQDLVLQAFDRLSEAQQANNSQLGGHAARAKELLREASQEIKLAAVAANSRW